MNPNVRLSLFSLVLAVFLLVGGITLWGSRTETVSAQATNISFTYQGQLEQGEQPQSGFCDFEFSLYNTNSGGTSISTVSDENVSVDNGLFTAEIVNLNFGPNAFAPEERWLEIGVRCPTGSGEYKTLNPRQKLSPAPIAAYSLSTGPVSFGQITGIPTALQTLSTLTCIKDQPVVWNGNDWSCGIIDWNKIVNVPSDLTDGDNDSLSALACTTNQIAKWNGSRWVCASSISPKVSQQAFATNRVATWSTSWVDMPNMSLTVTTGNSPVLILFHTGGVQPSIPYPPNAVLHYRIVVDGSVKTYTQQEFHNNGWEMRDVSLQWLQTLSAGQHVIKVQWRTRDSSYQNNASWGENTRSLIVTEL